MTAIIVQALVIGMLLSGAVIGLSAIFVKRQGLAKLSVPDLIGQWIGLTAILTPLQIASGVLHLEDNPIDRFFDQYPTRIFFAGIILAGVLFGIRKKRRDFYGVLEIGVALITLYTFATNPFSGPIAFAIGFATPVYILIRGLDNIDQYWEQEKATSEAAGTAAAPAA